jgi:Fur family ferric uptake transcriptional regulator
MEIRDDLHSAEEQFNQFLESKQLRKTPERLAILKNALSKRGHFTVAELHSSMESEGFHVSKATAYTTIELLTECGLLREQRFMGKTVQYESASRNHIHLICSHCGKVREVRDDMLQKSLQTRRFTKFKASYFTANIFGLCSACAKEEQKQQNKK